MEDILDLIKSRKSVRSFTSKEVSKETMEKIVEAGLYAPTARNWQNILIVGIVDQDMINAIHSHFGTEGNYYGAKALILTFETREDHLSDLNDGAAIQNMLLEATSLGVNSCWIHSAVKSFDTEEGREYLKELLHLQAAYRPLDTIALGYETEETSGRERNEDNAIVL